jgi:hypothetical protein
MKFRKNKKAQESLPTDIIITVVIVLMIVMALFVMNVFMDKKTKTIDTNMKELHAKRDLLTMLKTPAYGDITFSDLMIKHYYEQKNGIGGFSADTINTCSLINNFLETYPKESTYGDRISSRCFNINALVEGNQILKYTQCSPTDIGLDLEYNAHIPLPENKVIELTITKCSCSQNVNKRYFTPEFTCGSFFSS